MTELEQNILSEITKAKKIIVFSHVRPDWDAISSNLLTTAILKKQFPEKIIISAIEKAAMPNGEYLPGFNEIRTETALQTITNESPDLIIIVDCPSFSRISFNNDELKTYYNNRSIKIIGLDHHPRDRDLLADYISNHDFNDAVEEVHSLLITTFGFAEPTDTQKYLAAGILNDTNNFMFLKNNYAQTLDYAKGILHSGLLLDEVNRQITRYTPEHLLVLGEFLSHFKIEENITYFWVSDEFVNAHPEISRDIYSTSKDVVNHYFLRNISNSEIFLVMYREGNGYKGSYRALIGKYDTTVFARQFGGGGQKPAAGFFISDSSSITDALNRAVDAVNRLKESAKITDFSTN